MPGRDSTRPGTVEDVAERRTEGEMLISRPRVMYLLDHYLSISETYVQAEIEALRDDYEIGIISLGRLPATSPASRNHHPFRVIAEPRLMLEAVREFRPHVIHGHHLTGVQWLGEIAKRANVPFTVRAHSFESIWGERDPAPAHFPLVAPLLNDDVCLGILAFPFTRANLERAGIHGEKIHDCYPVINYERFHDRSPNGDGVMATGIGQPRKNLQAFIELAAATPGTRFSLYALGFEVEKLRQLNERLGGPVRVVPPVEPADMPREYKKHRWLVVTASEISSRGWPVSVAEAQASGVGVCAPRLRPDMREYVGECGFLYDSIGEAREIISRPFPEEMRQAGFEHARKSDIRGHRHVLTGLWRKAVANGRGW